MISNATIDSLTSEQTREWREIRKQMQCVGITPAFFYKNKARVMAILRNLTSREEHEAIVEATMEPMESVEEEQEDVEMVGYQVPRYETVRQTTMPDRRHTFHGRPGMRTRRLKNKHQQCSPSRQLQQWSSPTPMMIAFESASSLNSPVEHAKGITIERTPGGNSIISTQFEHPHPSMSTCCKLDLEAARRVECHLRRLPSHSKHERILRKLIQRDDPLENPSDGLDDHALAGILTTTDLVFFDGVLSGRVHWEWSSQLRYQTELIGTTALRRCVGREGFETLIVLSSPILENPIFDNRKLLMSTFLRQLVHCYLFICCGFEARTHGGHTEGFHIIASVIDSWVGDGYLSLCSMKANLEHFKRDVAVEGCTHCPVPGIPLVYI
jgi:hypothetical protein